VESSEKFVEPTTLEEAEQLRKQLTLDVQSIQAQLGDRQRTDESGVRLSGTGYWAWKKKAQYVLNQKLDDLRTVKAWIRTNRPAPNHLAGYQAIEHLRRLSDVMEKFSDKLDAKGQTELQEARQFLAQLS